MMHVMYHINFDTNPPKKTMDPLKKQEIENRKELLADVPERPQRQDSLNSQLRDLVAVAQKLGMYDAADFLKDQFDIFAK